MEDHQELVNNNSTGGDQFSSDESSPATPAIKDHGVVGKSNVGPKVLPESSGARSKSSESKGSESKSSESKDDKSETAGANADKPGIVSGSAAQTTPDNQPASESDDADAERNPFDFGGLPNRNLKKNLGCG